MKVVEEVVLKKPVTNVASAAIEQSTSAQPQIKPRLFECFGSNNQDFETHSEEITLCEWVEYFSEPKSNRETLPLAAYLAFDRIEVLS